MDFKLLGMPKEIITRLKSIKVVDKNNDGLLDASEIRGKEQQVKSIFEDYNKSQSPEKIPNENLYEIGEFRQGDINDCWLMTGIHNLKDLPDNGQKILKNTILKDSNGAYIIKFQGGKKNSSVNVSEDEINQGIIFADGEKINISSGDKTARLLEIAAFKYGEQYEPYFKKAMLEGGNEVYAWRLLTGQNERISNFYETNYENDRLNARKILSEAGPNSENFMCRFERKYECYVESPKFNFPKFMNYTKEIKNNHAYDISQITKNPDGGIYLQLINPKDTSKPIEISFDEAADAGMILDVVSSDTNKPKLIQKALQSRIGHLDDN